jgi:hypothetical protein
MEPLAIGCNKPASITDLFHMKNHQRFVFRVVRASLGNKGHALEITGVFQAANR